MRSSSKWRGKKPSNLGQRTESQQTVNTAQDNDGKLGIKWTYLKTYKDKLLNPGFPNVRAKIPLKGWAIKLEEL